jgi:hypothetical protein
VAGASLPAGGIYYGKPMDVRHWEIEQCYGIEARHLLTRLGLGTGVLCGLRVRLDGDGLVVDPGVAIDAAGREIVVPAVVRVANPAQPTDCMGVTDGAPVTNGTLFLEPTRLSRPYGPTPRTSLRAAARKEAQSAKRI